MFYVLFANCNSKIPISTFEGTRFFPKEHIAVHEPIAETIIV